MQQRQRIVPRSGFFSLLRGSISSNCSLTPVFAGFLVFLTGPALASQFVLEKGKGVEVCEAYGKNLNSLMDAPNRPSFQGSRPINPEFTDFSKPSRADNHVNDEHFVWADGASAEDSRHFGEEMDRFLWERDINPVYFIPVTDWPKWRGTREQRKQAWERFVGNRNQWHFLDIVKVDIDNDGVVEQVAMNARAGIGGILLVLNAKKDGLDMEKTKLVMQHPSWKEQGLGEFRKLFPGERITLLREKYGYTPVEDFLHGGSYDVFIYKDKTYFDLWWTHHPDYKGKSDIEVGGPLRVFMIENKRTREVCTYHYQHTE